MENSSYIKKAFLRFAVSCILSTLGIALGSFSDSVVVGNAFGASGLAVINIALPIYMIYNLLVTTLSVGAGIIISNKFGENNIADGQKYFSAAILLSAGIGVVIAVCFNIFFQPLLALLGARDDIIVTQCSGYIRTITLGAPIFLIAPTLTNLIRNDANPRLASFSTITYVIVNIVLDIVFIFVLKTGIIGAAYAIVIGEMVSLVISLLHFSRREKLLRLGFVAPTIRVCAQIIKNGFGVGSSYIYQAIVIVVFNNLLGSLDFIAIYGVILSLSFFTQSFFDGVSLATSPLIGTYLGEHSNYSIRLTVRLALGLTLTAAAVFLTLTEVFPEAITLFFGMREASLIALSAGTLRVYALSFVFCGVNTLIVSYFQSIKRSTLAIALNAARGMLIMLALGFALVPKLEIIGVAWTFFLTELLTLAVSAAMVIVIKRKERLENLFLLSDDKIPGSNVFETIIDSSLTDLSSIASNVEEFCESSQISPKKVYFVNLIIEELVVKIFEIGFKREKPSKKNYIMIKILKNGDEVNIHIRDDATGYNPFTIEDGSLDALGIDIVKQKAKYFNYQRKLIFNNLYVIL